MAPMRMVPIDEDCANKNQMRSLNDGSVTYAVDLLSQFETQFCGG
jgi:hypothetical protein